MYKQISLKERYKIEVLLENEYSVSEIANVLGYHRSSVYRELKRGSRRRKEYNANIADKNTQHRRSNRGSYLIKEDVKERIDYLLVQQQWSPEQIVHTQSKRFKNFPRSVNTIYRYIYKEFDLQGSLLYTHLRRGRKQQKKRGVCETRGRIVGKVNYRLRPINADNRSEVGHLEADLMIASKTDKKVLVTLVDRSCRYTLVGISDSKSEKDIYSAFDRLHEETPFPWLSITFDNGKEFNCHQSITNYLKVPCYFADPYSSWQRGTNENTNGLLRQYFPRKFPIEKTSYDRIKQIENKLNNRPRKVLNFHSPIQFMNDHIFIENCRT